MKQKGALIETWKAVLVCAVSGWKWESLFPTFLHCSSLPHTYATSLYPLFYDIRDLRQWRWWWQWWWLWRWRRWWWWWWWSLRHRIKAQDFRDYSQ